MLGRLKKNLVELGAAATAIAVVAWLVRRRYVGKQAPHINLGGPHKVAAGRTPSARSYMDVGAGQSPKQANDQPEQRSLSAATGDAPDPGSRFVRFWVIPLLLVACTSFAGAWLVFRQAYPSTTAERLAEPPGGIVLLVDAKAAGSQLLSGAGRMATTVAVDAEIWRTGDPNVSQLLLTLQFANTPPGSRWYVIASGQFFPQPEFEPVMFCENASQVVKMPERIQCRDTGYNGSREVEYRYSDAIGTPVQGKIFAPLNSLNGYDARSAAVITGVMGDDPDTATRVFVPHATAPRAYPGGDQVVKLAPIALYDNEFGSASPAREIAPEYLNMHGTFADVQSGALLAYLRLSELRLSVSDNALSEFELASVSPPTTQADQLVWQREGQGIGPISYRLHDPYAPDRAALWAFLAGVLASVGAAALLLLVERYLDKSRP